MDGHNTMQFLNCKLTRSFSSVSFIAAAVSFSAAQHWNKFCNYQKEAATKETQSKALCWRVVLRMLDYALALSKPALLCHCHLNRHTLDPQSFC
mmetsp:Transcript_30809/g.59402  ORF Transcript_30809/g.59402 Transcript_30809/m.59402 type:complete len:94 (-) Transcript_30809:1357-1638(-)